jgi:drug/metabolite transporter (DMT)-like permease
MKVGLSPRHAAVLLALTLVWGFNWPVMKVGVDGLPPLTFRGLSLLIGLPCLALALVWLKVPLRLPRRDWALAGRLFLTNMFAWHVLLMLALPHLSSGRAAILGYTMPVFSALWGWRRGQHLTRPQVLGVAATGLAVLLLLWHEVTRLSGAPWAALTVLGAAAIWAVGTQQMRDARTDAHVLTLSLWMTVFTTVGVWALAVPLEAARWRLPEMPAVWATLYNGLLVFGYCQPAWLFLARTLPPVASSISVMLIPVLGIGSGAFFLGEALHWQDGAAVLLILLAIGLVLLPTRVWRRA